MRLCYALLSPTFGMHQYTAHYANLMAAAGHEVHLVTTSTYPADRYAPAVTVHTPVTTHDTGFSLEGVLGLITRSYGRVFPRSHVQTFKRSNVSTFPRFDLVHFTGPHLWNPLLLRALRRAGMPTVHTLHDLDPHPGSPYGPLLHLWNGAVLRTADRVLVHGRRYRDRLADHAVTHIPLLHLFLSHSHALRITDYEGIQPATPNSQLRTILFFGRLERYKGVDVLLEAWAQLKAQGLAGRLVLAGSGALDRAWARPLPPAVELRNRRIEDAEALDLFRQCSLVVLPYTGATQSALIPAAYFFGKPVIATRSGALPEYVIAGETGWIVPPGDAAALASALATALADPARLVAMGKAGRVWYNRECAEEQKTLLELYRSVSST